MATRSNSQFLAASVTEFVTVWALGGNASLNLSTSGGITTVGFNCTLGHPSAPHILPPPPSSLTPAPPPPKPRHRGPAEREKNRLRAARHQAAQTARTTASASSASSENVPVTMLSSSPEVPTSGTSSTTDPVTIPNTQSPTVNSDPVSTVTVCSSTAASVMSISPESTVKVVNDLLCDQCNFEGVSSIGLKIHKSRKHEDIPQIDGESSTVRNTDGWWEQHRSNYVKSFQNFQNVLLDIEESALSKEEKFIESERVTSARKEALGKNYSFCPPWNTM